MLISGIQVSSAFTELFTKGFRKASYDFGESIRHIHNSDYSFDHPIVRHPFYFSTIPSNEEMLHTSHYRDRLREKIFTDSGYESLFTSFEGGNLIMWRWGSLVATSRALKRRAGPLRMLWSLEAYLSGAAAGEDVKTKTESLKAFYAAVSDPFFWHYLAPWLLAIE